jgi:hypothetical protein
MESAAVFAALLVAIYLPMMFAFPGWKEAENKVRERRMAEHRMNARLLRFDI